VGDGGIIIDDHKNVDTWVDAINHLLTNRELFNAFKDRAYQHAVSADFSPLSLAQLFLEICKAKPHRASFLFRRKRAFRKLIEKCPLFARLLN